MMRIDLSTRPARALLAAIRAVLGVVAMIWCWAHFVDAGSAALLGLLVVMVLGASRSAFRPSLGGAG